jgi:molybdopterin/thiamine biosynthesis adenylyltransferase
MKLAFTVSQTPIRLRGKAVPGAEDRQRKITGFDQERYSKAGLLCIGAGGLISHIAPTLVRKGIERITLLDDDVVEPSNLNRQRFYTKDIGRNKALALAENLERECIAATEIRGLAFRLEEAIARQIDLGCDVALCGVDNNPARVAASRYFRPRGIPVIFTGVSRDGDCGYAFIQAKDGPCIGCLYRRDSGRLLNHVRKPLNRISLGDLQGFAQSLVDEGLAPISCARTIVAIRSLFGFCQRMRYLPANPAAELPLPCYENRLAERILGEEDLLRVLSAATEPRNHTLLQLLYGAGLRVSEACGLRWRNLRPRGDAGQVTVFGKNGRTRAIALPTPLWSVLICQRGAASAEAPVFPSRSGRALDP